MNLPAKTNLRSKGAQPGSAEEIFGVIKGADGREVIISGLRVMVVGLGRTGVSVAEFLAAKGARVRATDLREAAEIEGVDALIKLGVQVETGEHDVAFIEETDLVVVSPGVPSDIELLKSARAKGVEIVSEIELASRFIAEPIVAIAGTNGKTTTATLIGAMLENAGKQVFVGGNIGTPAVDYLSSGKRADVCVLEVSSFQLEAVDSFRPKVAVLLNITEDHLSRYKDFNDYAETKLRLFDFQEGGDFAVVNGSDQAVTGRVIGAGLSAHLVPFALAGRTSVGDGVFMEESDIVFRLKGEEERYPTAHIAGVTNLENAMAAVAAARLMGAGQADITGVLNRFKPLSHRMERVRTLDGVTFINDSKGTNTGATVAALESLSAPVVLIAGGVDKGGDYAVLSDLVGEKVKLVVLTGEAAEKIEAALAGEAETIRAASFDEAVRKAATRAEEGDTVLLSPACSSFDEFSGYAERGDRFKTIVEGL